MGKVMARRLPGAALNLFRSECLYLRETAGGWDGVQGEAEGAGTTAVLLGYKASEDFVEPGINRRILPDLTQDPPIMAHMAQPETSRQKQTILTPTNINGVWAGDRMIHKELSGGWRKHF